MFDFSSDYDPVTPTAGELIAELGPRRPPRSATRWPTTVPGAAPTARWRRRRGREELEEDERGRGPVREAGPEPFANPSSSTRPAGAPL